MHQVELDEAKTRLPDLVDAAVKGEAIFILVEGRPVVQPVPVTAPKRRARFGSARGLVTMADDFDARLADFDPYQP